VYKNLNTILNTLFQFCKNKLGLHRDYFLPKYFYTSPDILEAEYKNLFYKLWIFAGLTSELDDSPKAWIKRTIGEKEVLIVKENEKYFALENVCPHRNIKLFDEDAGTRPLVCRYHAWSFNSDGSLKKIPFEDRSYKLAPSQLSKACLTKYNVEIYGKFIFVNLSKNPIKITDQIDPIILKSFKLLSRLWFNQIYIRKEIRSFNWKLKFENLRDTLHPVFLHSSTLNKEIDFSKHFEESKPLFKNLKRINLLHASSFTKDGVYEHGAEHESLFRRSIGEGYYNWFLYPNFHMASPDGGRTYNIAALNPLSPSQSEINHYLIVNKPIALNSESDKRKFSSFISNRLLGIKTVLEEDFIALEKVQQALKFTDREQLIGAYEHYNANIASLYRRLIKK